MVIEASLSRDIHDFKHKEARVSLKIDNGVVRSYIEGVTVPDVNFSAFFGDVFTRFKDETALVDAKTGAQYTFGELHDAALRVAAGLRRLGLRTGDIICFHAANGADLVIAMCGAFFAGGTAAMAKTHLTEREIYYQFQDSRPKFVVTDLYDAGRVVKAYERITSVQAVIVTTGSYEGTLSLSELVKTPLDNYEAPVDVSPDTTMAIIYSSGSTGLPKGVQLTQRNVIAQVTSYGYLDASIFQKGDILLGSAALMHVGGFWLTMCHLGHGCKVVLVHKPDFSLILPAIEKYKATSILLYPTFMQKLNAYPLLSQSDTRSLKKVMIAGNVVTGMLLQSITRKLQLKGVIQAYGMTELSGCISFSIPRLDDFKSVGKPAPFIEMKVVDTHSNKNLGPLEKGELFVKGPNTFKGYLGRPEETARVYKDGFIRTGDTGFYTPDGRFFVCGRLKELIKCMDQQVAPAELEEVLAADTDVRHVVVAGVPHPEYGEAARAFVVLERYLGDDKEESKIAARLRALVADQLSFHKHLHGGVEFLESIPHTDSGKDLRSALQQSYAQKRVLKNIQAH
ncbi:luciferin 4-monooxygenase-like [Rhipicephalus sanguineus]|uniref:luciferin 4-monooxygenase-like n=1 Tax=Rhipicephalus sanguineus TaxID=34632 RepID=UPI001895C10D|nr:luciferin 4-monooxygenase-like [Rhipicephalus sanguineus]